MASIRQQTAPTSNLSRFLEDARSLLEEDFVAKLKGHGVLMLHRAPGNLEATKFRTSRVESESLKAAIVIGLHNEVFVVAKKPDSSYESRISIGRSETTDVTIPYPGISKFHAYIELNPLENSFRLADGGSTNGTTLNSTPLERHAAVPLMSGNTIGLGPYVFSFMTANAFYMFLRRRSAPALQNDRLR